MKSYEQGKKEELIFNALKKLAANAEYPKLQETLIRIVEGAKLPRLPDDLMYSLTLKVASALMLEYINTYDDLLREMYVHATTIAKRLCLY